MQGTAFDCGHSKSNWAGIVEGAGRLSRVGSARRHRRWRSRKLLAALIIGLIVVGLGGAADLAYVSLKGQAAQLLADLTVYLQAGQRELEAGKTSLKDANTKHDVSLVAQAAAHFVAAKGQFVAAGNLADSSRLLQNLERIPIARDMVASRHAAVDGVAAMGVAISDAGEELATLDGQLLKPASTGPAGRTLLTVLGQAHTSLGKVRADLDRAQKAAGGVDVSVLPAGQQATLLKARDTISTALTGLDEFERLVPVLTEVLGGNGPRTFLIEQVNPAELRAGGGFIGTYSVLRADKGTLKILKSGDAYNLANPRPLPGQPGFIPQPSPFREVVPTISWSFVDSNIYPDFPSNATIAEHFAQPRIGIKLDAVIAMDYYTVAKMLDLTGPMAVPGFGTITGSNFIAKILPGDVTGNFTHKALLTSIAGPLMQRVADLPPAQWPALVAALNSLAGARHIQAFFNNATVEAEIDRVGWSGSINPTHAFDYMMEIESNYYGDKANYYIARSYTVVLARHGQTLSHKLTVDVVNATPCGIFQRTSYRADVRLYVAGNASSASNNLRPVKYANPSPPKGTRLADGWMADVLCGGGRGRAVFVYDTPFTAAAGNPDLIYWQKQPGTVNDKVDVTWNDGNGHTFKASGDLGQDRIISLSSTGVTVTAGQPAQATLPSLSLG